MKKNLLTDVTGLAMEITRKYISPGDLVVDATCGNGHDTLALAEAAGPSGRVLALDIQQTAVRKTAETVRENNYDNVTIVNSSFAGLAAFPELARLAEEEGRGMPSAVVFNLGYLPGGDRALTTRTEETLPAAAQALELIRPDGILTIVMYSGHPEGAREKAALLSWAEELDPRKYHVVYGSMHNQHRDPPEILWITRKV